MTDEQLKTVIKSQQGELDAVVMYQALAKTTKDQRVKNVLLQLAKEEGGHAAVFHELSNTQVKARHLKARALVCLRYIVGWKVLSKLIADGEYKAERKYESVVEDFPQVLSVQSDERRHGDIMKNLFK